MKFLFWSDFEPADEREAHLYANAYRRSLFFLWQAFPIIFMLLLVLPGDIQISHTTVLIVSVVLVLGSFLAGWTVLRGQGVAMKKRVIKKHEWTLTFYLHLVSILFFMSLIAVSTGPALYFIAGLGLLVGISVANILWLWQWTKGRPLHIRLLIIVFLREFALGYMAGGTTKKWMRVLQAIGFAIGIGALLMTFFVLSRTYFVEPFVITTDAFAPEVQNGDYVLVDKQLMSVEVGELVIFRTSDDDKAVVGRVESREGEIWSIKTEQAVGMVDQAALVGEIFPVYPGSELLQGLLAVDP